MLTLPRQSNQNSPSLCKDAGTDDFVSPEDSREGWLWETWGMIATFRIEKTSFTNVCILDSDKRLIQRTSLGEVAGKRCWLCLQGLPTTRIYRTELLSSPSLRPQPRRPGGSGWLKLERREGQSVTSLVGDGEMAAHIVVIGIGQDHVLLEIRVAQDYIVMNERDYNDYQGGHAEDPPA
jgi:hypothetical protein